MSIRRLAVAAVLALGLALVPAPAHAAPSDDLASLATQARWAQGLPGLLRNAAMDQVAANWAAELARMGTLQHNPNYSTQVPGGWSRVAENVAQGQRTPAAMHEAWMNSPGHRDNLLGDYTDIGVAFLSTGGTTWGVQVFAKYSGHAGPPPPAPAAAPAPPPAAPAPAAPAERAPAAEPTPEPTPDATAEPTRPPTPTATLRANTGSSDAPAPQPDDADRERLPPWWPIVAVVAVLAVASSVAVLIVRRQRLRR